MNDLMNSAADVSDQTDDNGNEAEETNLTNDTRFNSFLKKARGLGKDTALGADALPKLALEVTRAARDGTIDLEANKDALKQVYGVYWGQRSNKKYSIHAQGKDSQMAQVSKIKQHYLLGKNELFDGEEFSNRMVDLYRNKRTSSDVKMKAVYAAYTDAARMANEWKPHDGLTSPSDEEIEACFLPKERAEKTLTEIIEKVLKELDKVITGTRDDGISSQDTEITDAAESLQRFLAKMTLAAELDEFRAQSAKLAAAGLI